MSLHATTLPPPRARLEDGDRFQDEAPQLTMTGIFFPLGFPLRIHTNSDEVLRQCARKWGMFSRRTHDRPIEADIHVVEDDSRECPPAPKCHFMGNTLVMVADTRNVCTVDFPWGKTRMVVSTAALRHPHYFSQTFLEATPACQLCTRFATPIHAACVVLDGCGVLLCGDSGAGKTSLSYACARAGWQFVADDTSYLLHSETACRVIGNSHHVRFRPSAAELFPEIAGAQTTPRMSGKPSIEIPTASMEQVRTVDGAQVEFVVFLNRREPGAADLISYSRDAARQYMRKVLFGAPETRIMRHAAIERLLTTEVLELRYQSLEFAVGRLELLVRGAR